MTTARLTALLFALTLVPEATPAVFHVRETASGTNDGTSWSNAFVHLADALAVAQPGDEVWVATGTYRPDQSSSPMHPSPPIPGDRNATFPLKGTPSGLGVKLFGGFAGTEATLEQRAGLFQLTLLTGDLAGDDAPAFTNRGENSFHVVSGTGREQGAVVDGFRISGGNANGSSFGDNNFGGGVQLVSAVRNCWIVDNAAGVGALPGTNNFGAATDEVPLLEDCEISENRSEGQVISGGVISRGSRMIRCRVRDNQCIAPASSGFVFAGVADLVDVDNLVIECVFEGNRCSGLSVLGGVLSACDLDVQSSHFIGNEATAAGNVEGGVLWSAGNVSVDNSRFSGNLAIASLGSGGVAWMVTGDSISGCSFVSNIASPAFQGGVLFVDLGVPGVFPLRNSILWNNPNNGVSDEAGQIHLSALNGSALFVNNCIDGWTGSLSGTGNFGLDPKLVDPDGTDNVPGTADDDLRLTASSPCIDAGDNPSVGPDSGDLDGDGSTFEPTPTDLDGLVRFWDVPAATNPGSSTPPAVDIGCYEYHGGGCQPDLGFQGPGPVTVNICGDDLTTAGSAAILQISHAPPSAPILVFAGFAANPLPVPGTTGTLVPIPIAPGFPIVPITDANGNLSAAVTGSANPPVIVYVQVLTPDPSGNTVWFSNAIALEMGV